MSVPPATDGCDAGTSASRGGIVLIGPMGAGKSSVARALAHRTGLRWVDTDRMVSQLVGLSIAEIFETHGESHFRDLETRAIRSIASLGPVIAATGGGVVIRPENVEMLRSLGRVVWLTAGADVLFERVSRTRKRPLLETADPRTTLTELLEARKPFYTACAHCKIDTSSLTHAQVADAILAWRPPG